MLTPKVDILVRLDKLWDVTTSAWREDIIADAINEIVKLRGHVRRLIEAFDAEIHNEYDGTRMLEERLSEIDFARPKPKETPND